MLELQQGFDLGIAEIRPPARCGLCMKLIEWGRVEVFQSGDPNAVRIEWIARHECAGGISHIRWEHG